MVLEQRVRCADTRASCDCQRRTTRLEAYLRQRRRRRWRGPKDHVHSRRGPATQVWETEGRIHVNAGHNL
eukprot:scaffold39753_cov65-Phaeocystis_antarctica.AAC.10